jgi:hypothetical protein
LELLTVSLAGLVEAAEVTLVTFHQLQLADKAAVAAVDDMLVVAEHQEQTVLQTLAEAAVAHGEPTVDQSKLVKAVLELYLFATQLRLLKEINNAN